MSNLRAIATLALVILLPATALADDDDKKFSRRGFYLGVGGAYGLDFFEDTIKDAAAKKGVHISLSDTGGVNARVGYRVASWFALEGMYEWMDNFEVKVDAVDIDAEEPLPIGITLADYTTHTVTVNAKFLLPIWRIHPYLYLGVGGQYYDMEAPALQGTSFDFSESGWSFAGRPGVGVDAYITKNILLNVEVSGVLATSNPNTIPDIGDLFYMTFGGGLQYRF